MKIRLSSGGVVGMFERAIPPSNKALLERNVPISLGQRLIAHGC